MSRFIVRWLSFAPIPALLLIMAILHFIIKPSLFFEPSWLLPITNTLFVTVVCFVIAYVAARNYRSSGRIQVLLLGCGVLVFGVAAVLAAFVRGIPETGANLNVTVYNTGALAAAIFHFAAALVLLSGISPEAESRHKVLWAIGSYAALAVFMALFTGATVRGMVPPFFVQGVGATPLRQEVLGTADVLFVFSFLIFMGTYLKKRETFLFWYASALALTSISLTGFLIESAVGSPVGWASRFAQYLGCIYFLIAVVSAVRGAHARQTSFDAILTFALSTGEEKFRVLAESSPDAISLFDREMRHMYVNQAGVGLYGKPVESIVGKIIGESGISTDYGSALKERIERVFETGRPTQIEAYVRAGEATLFYQSRCVPQYGPDGTVATVLTVSRDLTESKRTEEERERLLEEMRGARRQLASDLEAMSRLQKLGSLFLQEGALEPILGQIVEAAIAISGADFGSIQLLDPKSAGLKIIAHRGFPAWWLDFWNNASRGQGLCGTALERRERVIVEDIERSPVFAGTDALDIQLRADVRALQSTPLVSRSGKTLGTFSTHYKVPHRPDDRTLRLLDLLARHAADIIDKAQADEMLRNVNDSLEQTVRERTEDLRRQAELLELAHSAILVRDMDSRITFWNARAEEVYGWTKSEAVGNITHAFLQTRFSVPFEEHMTTLLSTGRWEGDLVHTTKDGRQIDVLSRQALQRDADGNPVAIMEINLDITESKRTEQQLRQAQKMEALGVLSGGIAHDFNNILAAIIGFAELIKDHVPTGSRERRHAQRILDAGVRGRELVRQMLTFSRQTEHEKKPLRLSSIVKESVKLLRASLPSTLSIKVDVASESGVIFGDPTQIQQVFMNLCTNGAFSMREKGGTLDVKLSDFSVSPSSENPHGIEPGLYMRLTVRDKGAGIPPEIMDKIFDPFFTTKEVGEGTGLGLAVVLGIVKQSRGYITVESEPGRGSTFEAYFPKVAEEPIAMAAGDETIPLGDERVLFVDDEEALVEMGEELLAGLGYEVTCSTSGIAALALFRRDPSRFDVVVTDQTMPGMTGIQLTAELLSIRPDLPVILCTGFSHMASEESARAAGIKGFVMKPLTRREIARTMRTVLAG